MRELSETEIYTGSRAKTSEADPDHSGTSQSDNIQGEQTAIAQLPIQAQTGTINEARDPEHPVGPSDRVNPGQCTVCDSLFETFQGARLHLKRAHPLVYDSEILRYKLSTKNNQWTEAEKYAFARIEANLRLKHNVHKASDIYALLKTELVGYSHDQLKYRRRAATGHPGRVEHYLRVLREEQDPIQGEPEVASQLSTATGRREDEDSGPSDGNQSVSVDHDDVEPEISSMDTIGEGEVFKPYFEEERENLSELWTGEGTLGIRTDPGSVDKFVDYWLRTLLNMQRPEAGIPPPLPARVPKPAPTRMNRAQRRRETVWQTQSAYRKDKTRCFQGILNDNLGNEGHSVPAEELNEFWHQKFAKVSPPTNLKILDGRGEDLTLVKPISAKEVGLAVKNIKAGTAKGLDKIDPARIKRVAPKALRLLFNVFLATSYTPDWLRRGRVTLVPKKDQPTQPGEFRPITVTSILLRVYHGVLARRFDRIEISSRQKGFRRLDGICQNTWTLEMLIKHAKRRSRSLNLVFIDVAKAFDSLTHNALIECLQRVGVPRPLLEYIRLLYSQPHLVVGTRQEWTVQRCGILQGDPLSGYIFNIALDWAYSGLDPNLGFKIGERRISNLLFADDGILTTGGQKEAQLQLEILLERLGALGLMLNPAKCASLSLRAVRQRKWVAVDTKPFLKIDGKEVKALSRSDRYKYLGLLAGASGYTVELKPQLKLKLDRVSKSKLYPQQKMEILRQNILPGLLHQLTLGGVNLSVLRALDVTVRIAVRKWLHLPHDTPIGYLHANVKDGGLGIPALALTVPALAWKRIRKVRMSDDEILVELRSLPDVVHSFGILERRCTQRGIVLDSPEVIRTHWKNSLYGSVDGKGLENSCENPWLSRWVNDNTICLQGKEYVKAIRMRAGVVSTPARKARQLPAGGNEAAALCSSDRQRATKNHVAQVCQRTHGLRVRRHNALVEMIGKDLRRHAWNVYYEVRIPVGGTHRKPDIIATRGDEYLVLDPIISADTVNLEATAQTKVDIYDLPEVHTAAVERLDVTTELERRQATGTVAGIAFNNRGLIAKSSLEVLSHAGLSQKIITLMSVRILCNTHKMLDAYGAATA